MMFEMQHVNPCTRHYISGHSSHYRQLPDEISKELFSVDTKICAFGFMSILKKCDPSIDYYNKNYYSSPVICWFGKEWPLDDIINATF